MKTVFRVAVVGVFLSLTSSPCRALWEIAPVTPEEAEDWGVEVRSQAAGPDRVRVELEFGTEDRLKEYDGNLKEYSRVELRFGEGDVPPVSAPLREERTKEGNVVVHLVVDRSELDKVTLWIMIPGLGGGTVYEVGVSDFVEGEGEG